MIYYERKRRQNVEDLGSSSSSSALWGSSVENLPPHSGSDGPPHGPTKERKEKTKQGKRNWVEGGAQNTRAKTRRGSGGYL